MRRRNAEIDGRSTSEVFDSMRADYSASKRSRYRRTPRGVNFSGSGADYHYRSEGDFFRAMETARDYFRNNCLVAQGVRRLIDNVVQTGFSLDARTGSDKADVMLTQRWADWSGDASAADVSGRFTFHDQERLILQHVIVDGDIIVLPQKNGQVGLVEAHRMRTPRNTTRNVIHGVLLDQDRKPKEYWLSKDDIDPLKMIAKVADMKQYPARDVSGRKQVLHIYRPDRVSQTRGFTAFAPSIDTMAMGDDLFFAMLVKAQHGSVFTIFREMGESAGFSAPGQIGERETEILGDGSTRTIEGVAPGMEIFGRPGEKLHGFTPNIPNPEFFSHAKLILTIVANNLGLPLAVFLLDPSETNFSGWRGAIDQARLGFKSFQKWLVASFHQPIYQWKVRQWIAADPVLEAIGRQEGVDLLGHKWNPPTWAYIEPLKDASADLLRLRNAMISQRRRAAERGMDWGDLSTEIVEDNAVLIRKAKQTADALNADFDDLAVTWREVASLPTPDGVQVRIDAGANEGATS